LFAASHRAQVAQASELRKLNWVKPYMAKKQFQNGLTTANENAQMMRTIRCYRRTAVGSHATLLLWKVCEPDIIAEHVQSITPDCQCIERVFVQHSQALVV
jgi:hypothetical protein